MGTRPFDFIKEYYKGKIERDKKNLEFMFGQTDSFITWIIGFSFTGLLLAIGNLKNIQLPLSVLFKSIIACLFLTIISGVAFRFISFLVMSFEKELDDYYVGVFGDMTLMPFESNEEVDEANFDEIMNRLHVDFDEKLNYTLPITEDFKNQELPKLKEHYKNLCGYAKEDMMNGMNYIADVEYTSHRIPKAHNLKSFEKALTNPKIGYHAARWARARLILFSLCLLAFLASITVTFAVLMGM